MNDRVWTSGGAPLSRRRMLGGAVAAGAAAAVAAFPAPLEAAPWDRPAPATPEEALRALMDGNRRFVEGRITAPHRNLERVREVAPKQAPFAAVLGCADSRVPVELVFDQGFGDLFVCRAAGNVATPELIASLEFGTFVLGSKVLLVLGHSACGAVVAASARTAAPGQISALYQHLRPAVDRAPNDVERAIEENVRIQARLLAEASPVLAQLTAERKLRIVGGVYDLATGAVRLVDG